MSTALHGLRVTEIGDDISIGYAGKLLADLGATVLRLEPDAKVPRLEPGATVLRLEPGATVPRLEPGDSAIQSYPTFRPDLSPYDRYLHGAKLGAGDRDREKRIAEADVLLTGRVEAGDPAALVERHPELVVTTITPFGWTGPRADWKGGDLVAWATGGMAFASPGLPDCVDDLDAEPPLHPNAPVSAMIAGVVAAGATLLAVRQGGGHVDISVQAAIAAIEARGITAASYARLVAGRMPAIGRMPNFYLPCRDGWVVISAPVDHQWRRLVEAMGRPDWALSEPFTTGAGRTEHWDALKLLITEWTLEHSGADLMAIAEQFAIPSLPYFSIDSMLASDQVAARGSIISMDNAGRRIRMPGPAIRLRGEAAPLDWSDRIRQAPRQRAGLPLDGVRVLDFGQMIAVPFCTQWLSWMGAEVIVVERAESNTSRGVPPFADGRIDVNGGGMFNSLHGNSRSITIDLAAEEGRDAARRLAARADIVVDNFGTGVMEKLGLGYDDLRARRPDLIMLSLGAFGRTGPFRHRLGLHSLVNAFSGVAEVTGYPGGQPRLMGGYLPDTLSGAYCFLALLAALRDRERTGDGQYIDGAMYEMLLPFIAEPIIDGQRPDRIGNHHPVHAPHNLYRCSGDDRWIAISVEDDDGWQALCRVANRADWATDPRFGTEVARKANEVALDNVITAWTRTEDADILSEQLQAASVAAGPVLDGHGILDDPQLNARGTIIATDHPTAGRRRQVGPPWRITGVEPRIGRAPLLGEHTMELIDHSAVLSEQVADARR